MLVSAKGTPGKVREGKYAVGQFNINNLEWIKSVLLAVEELKSPVIPGILKGAGKYIIEFETVAAMVETMMEELNITIPAALHLDHDAYDGCYKCIKTGFSSITFDGSHYPIEENIEKTKELAKVAHTVGLSLEVEAGFIGGEEDGVAGLGEYADLQEYRATADLGIDFLAAGIGNIHGKYPENRSGLRFDVLGQIEAAIGDMPLAPYGGTGIPEDMIKRAISLGVAKINVNTECQLSFVTVTREYIEVGKDLKDRGFDPRKFLAPGTDIVRATAKEKVELFGSVDKT